MASTIKIKNSSTAGAIPTSGDLVQGELAINVTDKTIFTKNASGTVVELGKNFNGFKNRIINGAMMIAQRATSASPTAGGYFTIDRWRFSQASSYAASLTPTISQSSTAPTGFINSFLYTNGTGAAPTSAQLISIDQYIEGLNCADLDFGASTAATVTVSFWVRASVTGTYAVALVNSAIDRSYVTTYTVNSANTWEQKSVTIAGDTSGTWLKTNGIGITVRFPIGAGSSLQTTANAWQAGNYCTTSACTNLTATTGATFYITGVQLEKGSTATSFDYRPYGTELALCQRYYQKIDGFSAMGGNGVSTIAYGTTQFPVTMRSSPSAGTTAALKLTDTAADYTQSSASVAIMLGTRVSPTGFEYQLANFTGMTALRPLFSVPNETGSITLSAEL